MSEVIKDSAIKLFGRTISLPRNNEVSANGYSSEPAPDPQDCSHHSPPSSSSFPREVSFTTEHEAERDKDSSRKELTSTQDDEASHQTTSSGNPENPKTPPTERETSSPKPSKKEDQIDTTSLSQDKTPKKPDKVLPCPRCNSMDTKFCYYNNYNVNQPRHFCKHCQRYWTAGGTMRNVPVGAGRRKNKNSSSASHYRQMMVPEALQTHSDVLTMASVLSLAEKTQNGVLNGFHAPNNGDDNSNSVGASVMASTLCEKRESHEESVDKSYQGFTPQLCFSGSSSWPYPWNHSSMTPSVFSHPVSFHPTPPFWGCMPAMPPPSWSVNYQSAPTSAPNSPTLGKHSRHGDILFQQPITETSSSNRAENNNNNTSVLIPKTLRIDDPTEAAKSSIWSTLGIKNEKGNSLNGGGLFKAFASKGGADKNHVLLEASPVLQANPAALSRSLVFHERT